MLDRLLTCCMRFCILFVFVACLCVFMCLRALFIYVSALCSLVAVGENKWLLFCVALRVCGMCLFALFLIQFASICHVLLRLFMLVVSQFVLVCAISVSTEFVNCSHVSVFIISYLYIVLFVLFLLLLYVYNVLIVTRIIL